MPALVIFNRKWRVGSDDFVLPAIWSASIRLLVFIAALVVYITEHSFHKCPGGSILVVFIIGLGVLLSITIILEFIIAIISAQGSILNAAPRRYLPLVLYIRLFVLIVEVIWSGVGAFWVFQEWKTQDDDDKECDITVVRLVKTSLCCFWVLIFTFLIVLWLLFGPSIKQDEEMRGRSNTHISRQLKAVAKSSWEKRCQWLCCCAGKDVNFEAAYAEAAEILSRLFGTLDIVPSDVAAGFVLMQLEQQRRICRGESLTHHHFSLPSDMLLPTIPVSDVMDSVIYYHKYSAAIYGWPLFMETNLCCGACKLFPACTCFSCLRSSPVTENDNCCQCHSAAIMAKLGVEREDIIYWSFHNKIFQIPFMIVVDNERQSIVVAIRGTMSLKDVLTDVTAEAERVDIKERSDIYAHRGMVNTARFVYEKIKELNLLEEAKSRHPDYNVVVTGHSLGAGTAILVSAVLKDDWPELKCYAYASPFGLLNAEGVHFTKDFVTSVVLGLDLVPRLSIHTLNDLKDQVVEVVRHSPTPKYRILLGGCWYSVCGLPKLLPDADVKSPLLGTPIKHTNKTQDAQTAETGRASLDPHQVSFTNGEGVTPSATPMSPTPSEMRMNIELYPGGSILWIREADEDSPKGWCHAPSAYKVQWATYKQFDHIVISPDMIPDHFPRNFAKAFDWLKENMGEQMEVMPTQV